MKHGICVSENRPRVNEKRDSQLSYHAKLPLTWKRTPSADSIVGHVCIDIAWAHVKQRRIQRYGMCRINDNADYIAIVR